MPGAQLYLPIERAMVDKNGLITRPWALALTTVGSTATSGGDVFQVGNVTAGHLVKWTSSHHIQDGGAVPAAGITQLTGDVTAGPGSGAQAATLANTAVTPASYGDATHVATFTVDSKGRLTAAASVAITFPTPATDFVPAMLLGGM